MPLPDPIIEVLAAFRPLFTAPTWRKLMILLTGTLLAHGRRTVATALRHTGQERETNFSTFHQVLNRARWSPLTVSGELLTCMVETFVQAGGTLELVIDETLERRWGSQIEPPWALPRQCPLQSQTRGSQSGTAMDRHGRGRHLALDQTTLCLALFVRAGDNPSGKRHLGQASQDRRHVGASHGEAGAPLVSHSADHPAGDTSYSILELGRHAQAQQVTLITSFHLDAALHDPPPARDAHTIGRPRVVGQRLPSLDVVLVDPKTTWQQLTLDWYGQGERPLEICTGTALWYRAGCDPLPIRWVLTRDPQGKRPPKALFSTNQTQPAEQIVRCFMKRWSLVTTFDEIRAHVGIETQRQWADPAVQR